MSLTGSLRVGGIARASALFVFAVASSLPAHAQEVRWFQLSQQVVQLQKQGNYGAAISPAQDAVRVAQSTWGPQDRHFALSLNVLGILQTHLEKFTDAEASLHQALPIMVRVSGAGSADVAAVLNNLGDLYRTEGQYANAEKATAQALAIHEKLPGDNSANISTDASNLALIYEREGKYTEAEPLYRQAIAIDQKAGGASLSSDLSGLGSLYDSMGKYAAAEPLFTQALTLDVKALGNAHPQIALDLDNLGATYMYQGKFADAETVFGKGLEIASKANPPDVATAAFIEENAGSLFRSEGKYAKSESLLLAALENRAKKLGPDHPDVATILDNLGSLYKFQVRYSDAEQAYRRALDIRVNKLGPQHPLVGLSLINLANLYSGHGRWGEAETMYRNAMTIYLKVYPQTDARVADLLASAGTLFIDEGKLTNAEQVLTGSVEIFGKANGPTSPKVAYALNLLAEVYEYEGKHAQSETAYKQAIAIAEKDPASGPSIYLIGLAAVYTNQQRFAEAEPLLLRATKAEEAVDGPNDATLGETYMNLAAFYYAWGKPQQAAIYFDKRIGNLMDQFRANAATMSERDRLNFFATTPGAFPLYFSFIAKYHGQLPDLSGKMYDALLREKGFIAESAAAMRAAVEQSGDPQAVTMLAKLTDEKAQLAALTESTVGDPANRRTQIAQLQQDTNTLEQGIAKRSAAIGRQQTLDTMTWRDVQKALKPGEAAVEVTRFQFHTGTTFTSNILYAALVVTPQSRNPEFVMLGDAKDLEAAPMLAYRADVARTRGFSAEQAPAAPGQPASVPNTAAAYTAFWKPLEAALGASTRVYFAPDGVLNTIPIGLMSDPAGKLVMEKVQLRIVNSTKDLLRTPQVAQLKTALLVGNPKFDLTDVQQHAALAGLGVGATQPPPNHTLIAEAKQTAQRGGELAGAALNPLPGTQVEVNAIDKLLKNAGWQTTPYTGELALKQTVTRSHAPRVMHIATHGFFLSDQMLAGKSQAVGQQRPTSEDPMLRSGLFFAGADRVRTGTAPAAGAQSDDGVLTAYEASQLNLVGTELVVLSACETGLGAQSNSEGVFGLRRGLQEAGADAVMMSMWSVPDQETQELMALFYQKWLSGLDKPEALRQAQLAERETVRQRYGKDLPFYWGAFVMVSR